MDEYVKKKTFACVKVLLLKLCEQASSVQYRRLRESGIEILSDFTVNSCHT